MDSEKFFNCFFFHFSETKLVSTAGYEWGEGGTNWYSSKVNITLMTEFILYVYTIAKVQ